MQTAKVIHGEHWSATQGNGSGSQVDLPKLRPSLLSRLYAWFRWENLIVAGKEVKGFVITPAVAATITGVMLTAFLSAIGWAYSSNTKDSRDTRDAVIRMETMLNERTKNFEREQDRMDQKISNEIKLAEMRREQEATKRAILIATLRQKGIIVE